MSKSTDFTITRAVFVNPAEFPTDETWVSASEFTRTRGDDTYAFVTRAVREGRVTGEYRWQIIHYPKPMLNGDFAVLAEGVHDTCDEAKAVSLAWLALHG